jgi:integrase
MVTCAASSSSSSTSRWEAHDRRMRISWKICVVSYAVAPLAPPVATLSKERVQGHFPCSANKPALHVRRTLTRGENGCGFVIGSSTKSGKGRRVRLTQRAVAALKDHRKRQLEERMRLAGLWQDRDLIFPNETGSVFNPSNLRNRSFKRTKARSRVREDLCFHDLRHTCATLLLREGVNAKVVSEMLGHASITITLNIYAHVLPDMQDSAANAMEAALGGVL